jgi:OPT family oligopeptide transporter
MGGVLGMLMSVSNLYTTLKIGWLFGVAITACVMSYVIWNLMRALSFGRLSQMSILENACMASTASAAGYSTGSTIATMFGAMLIIKGEAAGGNISTLSVSPWYIVAAFTLCTAALGVFLAVPMKRQMINREQLPFPSGIAAAATLRSLYSQGREAVLQAYVLIAALFGGVLIGLLNTGKETYAGVVKSPDQVPRIMAWLDVKVFGRLPELIPHNGVAQVSPTGQLINALKPDGSLDVSRGKLFPGFGFEPSGLLIAAGMLVGLRSSLSIVAASIVLYLWVGPWLVAQDTAHAAADGYVKSLQLNGAGTTFRLAVWSLWGGTATMVMASLTAVALQWRTLARAFGVLKGTTPVGASTGAEASLEVPTRWFIIGMIPISFALMFVQMIGFQMAWYYGLAAVAMSFVLALVACRATGETDTTPIGAMGKVMQLVFAVIHPGHVPSNLASAGVAANGASAAADLLTDLKTGYLLGANPRRQFIAQFVGIFFGTAAIVPAWYLMVPDKAALDKYPAPSTQQWAAVARLLTEGVHNLPLSAQWAILIGALVGVGLPVLESFMPRRVRPYMPSAMGLGLSWIMPFSNALAFGIGAVIAWIWTKLARSTSSYMVPVASGLIAGEGLVKAFIAMSATVLGLWAAKG